MASGAKLRCAGDSDPGRARSNNEDRFWCDPDRGIFLIIDGVGGQTAGEKAADIAVNMIRGRLERQTGGPAERIREAIAVANNEILRTAHAKPELAGMACVLTVAIVDGDSAYVGHVGDSRLYKIHRGRIAKITHDHSPVGEREDSQDLSEADAMRHPRRNEVYRDVGSEEHTPDDPDFIESIRIAFEPDSALLLCSDGLSDQVTSAEILHAVEHNATNPHAAVRELIAAANRAGGKDNVSVAIVEGAKFGAPQSGASPFASRPAIALYGFLAGLLLLAALQLHFGWLNSHPPPSPRPEPRVLVVSSSIADALAQARPGDTVEVPAGEYREQINVREGVNIISRVPLEAIIRAEAAGIDARNIKSARISGLRILSDPEKPLRYGILMHDSAIEVTDCQISGSSVGIFISDGHPAIRANSIQDSLENGLTITGAATPWISHNDFVRNGRKQKKAALFIGDQARPVLVGNTFADSGAEAVSIPNGMDAAPIRKFNFFVNGKAVGAR